MRLLLHFCNSIAIIAILAVTVNKCDDYRRRKLDVLIKKTEVGHILTSECGEILYTTTEQSIINCRNKCLNKMRVYYDDIKRVHPKLIISDFKIITLKDGNQQVFFRDKPLFVKSNSTIEEPRNHLCTHLVVLNGN